jgi:nitric oxide reductase NorQ protein
MSTITHITLARVTGTGVARLVYAHPIIQNTSLDFRNSKVIKPDFPIGSFLKLVVKMMPSGKRLLLSCSPYIGTSIEQFINEYRSSFEFASRHTGPYKTIPAAEKFDGTDDARYVVSKSMPRFSDKSKKPVIVEVEETPRDDGYVPYGNLFIHKILVNALDAITEIAKGEGAANLLLVGSSGNGKTSLAYEYAKQHDMSFIKVNCSTVRDPEEWFGFREAREGSTIFVETPFVELVKRGNAVILLDEINRLEPYLHNSLLPLLDETRNTIVHGHDITVGPNVVFMCTLNMGSGFVGTFTLDSALKNRMDATVVMPSLTQEREVKLLLSRTGIAEKDALKIVASLTKVRETVARHQIEIDVSHRSALKLARVVKTGKLTMREAFALVIFNNAESPEQTKLLVDTIVE